MKYFIALKGNSLLVLLSFACLKLSAQDSPSVKDARPNIIFVLTDDQRWDALGAMGNPIIKTPYLDALASAGILFQNAYVTTSICCVSRASILTGQYGARHGITDFATDLSAEAFAKSYPALLKKAGYEIGFIGKFGVGNHPPGRLFDYWVDTEDGGKGQPDYIMTEKGGRKIHDTDSIGHALLEFLDQSRQDRPFCLSVSFKAPHEQDGNPPTYIVQPRYQDYYKDVTIPLPVTGDSSYWNRLPPFLRTDKNIARVRWKGLFGTPEKYQENVKNYYRLISGVDEVIGEMMRELKKTGKDKNTIILFMGDNGFFLGEHGMEGKWYGYEESIRVPMLIYDPLLPDKLKQIRPQEIALNIDIAPTILSMAGVAIPDSMQGEDLIGMLENKVPERAAFFYQHNFLGSPQIPAVEGVVTGRFKYMDYTEHHYEELFDIKYDPHETVNLAGDPKYAMILKALRKKNRLLKAAAR
jgi:arylsulfatase A-like enzyme